ATAPPVCYSLSLHDALPIFRRTGLLPGLLEPDPLAAVPPPAGADPGPGPFLGALPVGEPAVRGGGAGGGAGPGWRGLVPGLPSGDRKSTRLNSSHVKISYAV